jgi:hypothetical protein
MRKIHTKAIAALYNKILKRGGILMIYAAIYVGCERNN